MGERNRSKTREGLQSLSTCSKTQCRLLKTAKGRNVCQQWAKSRLPGSRDSEMKAAEGRGGGVSGWVLRWRVTWRATRQQEANIMHRFLLWASCSHNWSSNWQLQVLQSFPKKKKHLRQWFSAGGVEGPHFFYYDVTIYWSNKTLAYLLIMFNWM